MFFFPLNVTSLIQPLDQQIIKVIKDGYRKKLLVLLSTMAGDDTGAKLKTITIKHVVYMVTESWNNVSNTVISNAFKKVCPNNERDEEHGESSLTESEGTSEGMLIDLYHRLIPDTELSDDEIMRWAGGEGESSMTITDDEIMESSSTSIPEVTEVEMDDNSQNCPVNIDHVIRGINTAINWAEEALPLSDILSLRRIREKAFATKLNF